MALVLAAMALPIEGSWRDAEAGAYPRLWGTKEIRQKNLKPFPQWTGVLKRYFKESELPEKDCGGADFNKCHLAVWRSFLDSLADESVVTQNKFVNRYMKKWQGFLDSLADKSVVKQIKAVNSYMNKTKYITDIRNWGVRDYWVTPQQFFARNGDCEDYAIAKYMSLRILGFPVDKMRIVALKDQNLNIGHAVLVIYLKGKAFILDNQIKRVISAKKIKHYKPYYSINENNWWLHKA